MKTVSLPDASAIRWDLSQRYKLIELIALWEGRLTTNIIMNAFGISRQQASKHINVYNRDIAPDNLEYDRALKGYKPSPHFNPIFTNGTADDYLQLVSSQYESDSGVVYMATQSPDTAILRVSEGHVSPEVVRPIVLALRRSKRLRINYVSLANPIPAERVICPHTIIFSGYRWYVRGYCEKRQEFRNFVLSRFRGVPKLEGPSTQKVSGDGLWNKEIEVQIVPDPRLRPDQKSVIEYDYGMKSGMLRIKTRAALVDYVIKLMRADPAVQSGSAEAQQIVVANLNALKPYLF